MAGKTLSELVADGAISTGADTGAYLYIVEDTSSKAIQLGNVKLDTGAFLSDTGQFLSDSGTFLSDSGVYLADTGQFLSDSGVYLADTGQFLSDTGPFVTDTGGDLQTIAALLTTEDSFIVGNGDTGAGFELRNPAQVRQTLSLDTGSNPQFASLELGDATDTTLTRSDSGTLAVEGNVLARREPKSNIQTGQFYSLVLADAGKIVAMDTGEAVEVAIPPNSSVAFPLNTIINIIQYGTGTVTIDADTGVTLNGVSSGSAGIQTQYQAATLWKRDTNTWVMSGDIGTVA